MYGFVARSNFARRRRASEHRRAQHLNAPQCMRAEDDDRDTPLVIKGLKVLLLLVEVALGIFALPAVGLFKAFYSTLVPGALRHGLRLVYGSPPFGNESLHLTVFVFLQRPYRVVMANAPIPLHICFVAFGSLFSPLPSLLEWSSAKLWRDVFLSMYVLPLCFIYVYVCMHVSTYVYMYVCLYVCM